MVRALHLLLNACVVSSTPGIEQTGLLQTAKRDGLTRVAVHEKWRTEEACRTFELFGIDTGISTGTCPPQVVENLRSGFNAETEQIKATMQGLRSAIADTNIAISDAEDDKSTLEDEIKAAIGRAGEARAKIQLLNEEVQEFNDLVETQTTDLNTLLSAAMHKLDQVEAAGERIVSWFKTDYQSKAAVAEASDTASTGLLQTNPSWTDLWNSIHGIACDVVEWSSDTCRSRVSAMRQACREAADQLQNSANVLNAELESYESSLQTALTAKGKAQTTKVEELATAVGVEQKLARLERQYEQSQETATLALQNLQERVDHLTGQIAAFGEAFSPELFNALVQFGTASPSTGPAAQD